MSGRREFALVLRRGARAGTSCATVFTLAVRDAGGPPKLGILITKKVGNAVKRNRLRRRCRAIFDGLADGAKALWCVIVCKPEAANLAFAALRDQLTSALTQSVRRAGKLQPVREAIAR